MNLEARKAIIFRWFPDAQEGHLSNGEPVYWIVCPGRYLHENPNALKHTCIHYTGTTLTIDCKHQHCHKKIWPVQRGMRSQLAGMPDEKPREVMNRPSTKTRAMLQFAQDCADKINRNLKQILGEYWDESFLDKRLSLEESRARFFNLFPPDKIIWIGQEYNSGTFRGDGHFRTVEDWIYRCACGDLYSFTSTGIYLPGSWSRSVQSVIEQPYLVLEFDSLDPDPVRNMLCGWALFRYLEEKYQLQLVLVVDTGNKSPHFWIRNEPRFDQAFKEFLRRVGADPRCFRPSQPVRFPGVMRTDAKVQNQPQCVIAAREGGSTDA